MYDPATVDEARQSVLAFDPATGKMEEIFIGNIESDWSNIKSRFMYDNGYESEAAQFKKDGGSLYLQSGGEFSSYAVASQFKKERNFRVRSDVFSTLPLYSRHSSQVSYWRPSFSS